MAAYVQTNTVVITISKLVKVDAPSPITDEILASIETIVQELLGDTVIVEVEKV